MKRCVILYVLFLFSIFGVYADYYVACTVKQFISRGIDITDQVEFAEMELRDNNNVGIVVYKKGTFKDLEEMAVTNGADYLDDIVKILFFSQPNDHFLGITRYWSVLDDQKEYPEVFGIFSTPQSFLPENIYTIKVVMKPVSANSMEIYHIILEPKIVAKF